MPTCGSPECRLLVSVDRRCHQEATGRRAGSEALQEVRGIGGSISTVADESGPAEAGPSAWTVELKRACQQPEGSLQVNPANHVAFASSEQGHKGIAVDSLLVEPDGGISIEEICAVGVQAEGFVVVVAVHHLQAIVSGWVDDIVSRLVCPAGAGDGEISLAVVAIVKGSAHALVQEKGVTQAVWDEVGVHGSRPEDPVEVVGVSAWLNLIAIDQRIVSPFLDDDVHCIVAHAMLVKGDDGFAGLWCWARRTDQQRDVRVGGIRIGILREMGISPVVTKVVTVIDRLLLNIRQNKSNHIVSLHDLLFCLGSPKERSVGWWEEVERAFITESRQPKLLHVVFALNPPSGCPDALHCWQEQGQQNADNGDND